MGSFTSSIKATSLLLSTLTLAFLFQNCAPAKFETDASFATSKAGTAGDDVSLVIPNEPSASLPGNDSSTPTTAPSSPTVSAPTVPKNSQTTTIITTGGKNCPTSGSTAPSVNINVSGGSNSTVSLNNYSMKAAENTRSTLGCANLDVSDVQLQLSQLVIRETEKSPVVLASLSGQFLTKDEVISFVAAESVSDVEKVFLVLQSSGHKFINSKAEVKSMALKDSSKRNLPLALAQRTSFEKGRSYKLRLVLSESSSLVDDSAGKCLLKPVLEVQ